MVFVALITYFEEYQHDVYGNLAFSQDHISEIVRPDLPVLFNKREDAERYLCDKMETDILNVVNYYDIDTKKRISEPTRMSRHQLKELGVNKYFVEIEHETVKDTDRKKRNPSYTESHFELKSCYKGNLKAMNNLYKVFLKGYDANTRPRENENYPFYLDWRATYKIKEIEVRSSRILFILASFFSNSDSFRTGPNIFSNDCPFSNRLIVSIQ